MVIENPITIVQVILSTRARRCSNSLLINLSNRSSNDFNLSSSRAMSIFCLLLFLFCILFAIDTTFIVWYCWLCMNEYGFEPFGHGVTGPKVSTSGKVVWFVLLAIIIIGIIFLLGGFNYESSDKPNNLIEYCNPNGGACY